MSIRWNRTENGVSRNSKGLPSGGPLDVNNIHRKEDVFGKLSSFTFSSVVLSELGSDFEPSFQLYAWSIR